MALIGVRNTSLLSHRPALCGKSSEGNAGFGFSHRSNAGESVSRAKRLLNFLHTTSKRLLAVSGLTVPLELCVGIVLYLTLPPIIDNLNTTADPPKYQQGRAEVIRALARASGFNIYPLLLTEREQCEHCHHYELLFVMPDGICWGCWERLLEKYNLVIKERRSGKPVK